LMGSAEEGKVMALFGDICTYVNILYNWWIDLWVSGMWMSR
jgi:hypothetical protein